MNVDSERCNNFTMNVDGEAWNNKTTNVDSENHNNTASTNVNTDGQDPADGPQVGQHDANIAQHFRSFLARMRPSVSAAIYHHIGSRPQSESLPRPDSPHARPSSFGPLSARQRSSAERVQSDVDMQVQHAFQNEHRNIDLLRAELQQQYYDQLAREQRAQSHANLMELHVTLQRHEHDISERAVTRDKEAAALAERAHSQAAHRARQ